MSKPAITFYDTHALDKAAYEAALGGHFALVFCEDGLSPETAKLAQTAAIVSVHVSSPVTAEIMSGLPQLQHVACRSTGFDNVDLEYARSRGISVSNVPAYGQETVAEFAFLLMLGVARKIMQSAHSVHARSIVPEKLTGRQLSGSTLGVIGTGRIGQHAASIGRGFGMTVIAYDPMPQPEAAKRIGYTYLGLDEVLASANFITLHAPAVPATYHMLGPDQFAKMKRDVIIVNTARGSLIDTTALIEGLTSGVVGGAGLDVLDGEEHLNLADELHLMGSAKLGTEARQILGIELLHTLPNVLITSHNAYNTLEALGRIRQTTAENILAWADQKPQNIVN